MANLRTDNLCGEGGRNAYRGSVFFNGEEDHYLTLASGALISGTGFGTGDFTVEFWINADAANNATNYTNIISLYASTNTKRFQIAWVSSTIQVYTNTGSWADTGYAPTAGVYEHIAFQRDYSGNTLKMYANGEEKWSVSNNRDYDEVFETFIGDGPTVSYSAFSGYLSNVRICIGHLVYSSNYFTPPTSELEVHYNSENDKTILLCCQDSNDPTQEATGKTITANGKLATVGYLETQPKVIPPYGVDAGNTFNGAISMNSSAYMNFPTGRTEERGRGRAVIFAGSVTPVSPNFSSNIDYVEMRSSGVGVRFGNCTANSFHGSCGSSTRGFMFGGQIGSPDVQTNLIEFVTIASEGNSTDFGDLLRAKRRLTGQGHSNSTRAILAGGGGDAPLAPDNVIQFFTMASTGDATDFGDLNAAKDNSAGTGSATRMLIAGGRDYTPSATVVNKIEYITMSTTGNVTDFGDLTVARAEVARASNAVRSVFVSGGTPSPKVNTIDFVTTATTGNATDFGDLPIAKGGMASANNSIIGIFVAGTTGSRTTDIQSLTIATTGNGVAFGDCNVTDPSQGREGCSDSHGGLS